MKIDGEARSLELQPGAHQYQLYSSAPGSHVLRLTRRVGPMAGPSRIVALTSDGPVLPTAAPERRLLVFGDSISTGYGVDGANQSCSYTYQTANADNTYVAIAARRLHADLHNISFDGRGLIKNYSGFDAPTMSEMAWRTLPDDASQWPATNYAANLILVNLGANDFSMGDISNDFTPAYVAFLSQLRSQYAQADIIAAIGPMLDGASRAAAVTSITQAVNSRKADGDTRLTFVEFNWAQGANALGCDWHPGRATHAAMADTLVGAARSATKW